MDRLTWAGNSGTPAGGDHCGSTPTGSTTPGYTQSFSYDELDRMTQGSAGTESYGDAASVHAATDLSSVPTPYASYDAMGDMTCRNVDTSGSQSCASGAQTGATMSYDNEGRLASWTAPTGITASDQFLYDNEGNRVLQRTSTTPVGSTTPSVTDTITFDGYSEVAITDGGTPTITNYFSVAGQRVAMRKGAILSYLVPDFLGSSSVALNSDGSIQAVQLYAPYGSVRYSDQIMPTDYNFTGQRLDSQTGLLYDNARYYDSVSGRFISSDTVQNNAKGMDSYAYVGDNPVVRTDPSGKCYPLCTMLIGAAIGAVVGVGATLVSGAIQGKMPSGGEIAQAAVTGAVAGAITGLAGPEAGPLARVAVGAVANAAGQAVGNEMQGKPIQDGLAEAAISGAVTGGVMEGVTGIGKGITSSLESIGKDAFASLDTSSVDSAYWKALNERADLGLLAKRQLSKNYASLTYDLSNGDSGALSAVSGQYSPPGTSPTPTNVDPSWSYNPFDVNNHPTTSDSEYKLVTDFTNKYQNYVGDSTFTGDVSIYSELDFCSSCSNIINSFSNNFPGLNVTINHGLPYDY